MFTWNVAFSTTTFVNLYELITHSNKEPTIIALQETKLTAIKSTKLYPKVLSYIQILY
jgi:exonuclease III